MFNFLKRENLAKRRKAATKNAAPAHKLVWFIKYKTDAGNATEWVRAEYNEVSGYVTLDSVYIDYNGKATSDVKVVSVPKALETLANLRTAKNITDLTCTENTWPRELRDVMHKLGISGGFSCHPVPDMPT